MHFVILRIHQGYMDLLYELIIHQSISTILKTKAYEIMISDM